VDVAIQYSEELSENDIKFVPRVEKIGDLKGFYGHREADGQMREIFNENLTVEVVQEGEMLKLCLNDELFSTEVVKN